MALLKKVIHNFKVAIAALEHYSRGIHRNFEKGFPLLLSDCYIRVVYIA